MPDAFIYFAKDRDSNAVGLWFNKRPTYIPEKMEFNMADVYVDDEDAMKVIGEKGILEGHVYTIRCKYLGKDKE